MHLAEEERQSEQAFMQMAEEAECITDARRPHWRTCLDMAAKCKPPFIYGSIARSSSSGY